MSWEEKLQAEISQLAQVMFANFKHAINQGLLHAPDQLDPKQRALVFEAVVSTWIGGAINPIATYANTTKEMEDMVVAEVRRKFEWIRKNEVDLQLARLDKQSEERKTQSGLILAPGSGE